MLCKGTIKRAQKQENKEIIIIFFDFVKPMKQQGPLSWHERANRDRGQQGLTGVLPDIVKDEKGIIITDVRVFICNIHQHQVIT